MVWKEKESGCGRLGFVCWGGWFCLFISFFVLNLCYFEKWIGKLKCSRLYSC